MNIGDKVYSEKHNLKGEVAKKSACKYFGHNGCEEELIALADNPSFYYHTSNFVLVTD